MSVAAEKYTEANLLQQVDVIIEREGGLLEAFVPIELIDQEEVAYDEEHAQELAASIKKQSEKQNSTGQLSAVLLAEVPGLDRFVIIDGFHRTSALTSLGKTEAYATIKPNCTWDEVVDLRIVAAKSHKSVKFARIVEWVEEAWQRTEWSSKINSSSAFQLYFLPKQTGGRSGLTQDEAQAVRQWVEQKCAQWDISAPAVDRFLRTARVADPELVKMARERKSGHKLEAITPKHLSAIAQLLPNNYELQRLVADTAVTNTLTIPEARALALAISKESDRDKVSALVESKVWERMSVGSKSLTKARHPEIDLSKPESYLQILQDKFFDDQVSIAQLLIENAILTGVYTPREEAGPRLNTLVVEADLPDAIQELPEDQREPWEADKVAEVAEKVVALNGLMSSFIYRRYGMSLEDREDIISTATIRFLTRVSDGRLSKEYAENGHLQRLLLQFVSYATIDHIRALRGRNGDKPIMVSLDAEDDEGFSLKDRLSIPESEEPFDINAQNGEFIKSMLPHLNERERRVLMLKGYFGLTYAEIGLVIGTTEATIAQAFNTCKKKALKLSDKAALAFLS